jgi:hypothetical protein
VPTKNKLHSLPAASAVLVSLMGPAGATTDADDVLKLYEPNDDRPPIVLTPLDQEGTLVAPLLGGGVVVMDTSQFPGVVVIKSGASRCTASVVGPRAVLTAAHCLDGRDISFSVAGQDARSMRCHFHAAYDAKTHLNDYAMCQLSEALTGTLYETVNVNSTPTEGNLLLTGYGCTNWGADSDGKLRAGTAAISEMTYPDLPGVLVAKAILGGEFKNGKLTATLCSGDSGGPVYTTGPLSVADNRQIVGINSLSDFSYGISVFAPTGSGEGKRFIEAWVSFTGESVCGVNTVLDCF